MLTRYQLAEAFQLLRPKSESSFNDDTYEGIIWRDPQDRTMPSKVDVERQIASIAKREKIAAAFEAAVAGGVSHRGKIIQVDDASRSNIISMALTAKLVIDNTAGVAWPADMTNVGWRTKDNTYLPMTAPQMVAMALACMQRFMAMRYRFGALKDALAAARTVAEVEAIDASSGWA